MAGGNMKALVALAALLVSGVAAGQFETCYENTLASPQFALGRVLGACPLGLDEEEHQSACCPSALEVFGEGSALSSCLCDGEYFTLLEAGLPDEVNSEDLFDGLAACGIELRGSEACGGEDGPLVQGQLVLTKLAIKKIAVKKLLGKALLLGAVGGGASG